MASKHTKDESFSFAWRFAVLFGLFCVLLITALLRLFQWQVVKANQFVSQIKAQDSYQTPLLASRGVIKTSDGLLLAINKLTYQIYIYTPQVKDIQQTLTTIASYTHIDEKSLENKVNNAGKAKYFLLASNVPQSAGDALETQNLNGITLNKVESRVYPNGAFLAQVIGFFGNNSYGQQTGLYGIEQYYNGDLSGQNGFIKGQQNGLGDPALNQDLNVVRPQAGRDVTLTINSGIQKVVEAALKKGVEDTKSKMGTAIVMDPKTGAIVAMAGYPTFDPNTYWNGAIKDCQLLMEENTPACNKNPPSGQNANIITVCDPLSPTSCKDVDISKLGSDTQDNSLSVFDNPAISFVYEPGSVIKLVTGAAALQDNKIKPDTKFDDEKGYIEVGGYKIYNFNKLPVGKVTMGDILKYSSNVGASMVAQLIGSTRMYDYLKAFGFGDVTGVDLSGEQTGTIPPSKDWHPSDLATSSFGQFFGATPLQVISMTSAIANGGVLMKPYIVSKLSDPTGTITIKPQQVRRVISQKSAQELTTMMIEATTYEPAYGLTPIKQYMPMIASKTGTAQVPLKDASGYDPNNINATYVGFAPANNPKFVLLVMLQYPQTGPYAATTVVPIWEQIAKSLFLDYQIAPQ